jgi:mRNA-degrading endonuclease toxin of MazEF toxin-antitoxin module
MVQGRGFATRSVFSPKRRDIVMMDCSPSAGVEPANPHPALVLSPHRYNVGGLALMCHITSTSRNSPFEFFLRPEHRVKHGVDGYLQCDQVRCLDWKERRANRLGEVSEETFREVTSRLLVLINPGLGNASER